jgi:hypothetical protein
MLQSLSLRKLYAKCRAECNEHLRSFLLESHSTPLSLPYWRHRAREIGLHMSCLTLSLSLSPDCVQRKEEAAKTWNFHPPTTPFSPRAHAEVKSLPRKGCIAARDNGLSRDSLSFTLKAARAKQFSADFFLSLTLRAAAAVSRCEILHRHLSSSSRPPNDGGMGKDEKLFFLSHNCRCRWCCCTQTQNTLSLSWFTFFYARKNSCLMYNCEQQTAAAAEISLGARVPYRRPECAARIQNTVGNNNNQRQLCNLHIRRAVQKLICRDALEDRLRWEIINNLSITIHAICGANRPLLRRCSSMGGLCLN